MKVMTAAVRGGQVEFNRNWKEVSFYVYGMKEKETDKKEKNEEKEELGDDNINLNCNPIIIDIVTCGHIFAQPSRNLVTVKVRFGFPCNTNCNGKTDFKWVWFHLKEEDLNKTIDIRMDYREGAVDTGYVRLTIKPQAEEYKFLSDVKKSFIAPVFAEKPLSMDGKSTITVVTHPSSPFHGNNQGYGIIDTFAPNYCGDRFYYINTVRVQSGGAAFSNKKEFLGNVGETTVMRLDKQTRVEFDTMATMKEYVKKKSS